MKPKFDFSQFFSFVCFLALRHYLFYLSNVINLDLTMGIFNLIYVFTILRYRIDYSKHDVTKAISGNKPFVFFFFF